MAPSSKEWEPSDHQLSISRFYRHSSHNCEQVERGLEGRWEEGIRRDKVGIEQSGKSWTGQAMGGLTISHESSWLEGHTLTTAPLSCFDLYSISYKTGQHSGVCCTDTGKPLTPAEPEPLLTDTKQYVTGPNLCASCWRCGDQAEKSRVRQPT